MSKCGLHFVISILSQCALSSGSFASLSEVHYNEIIHGMRKLITARADGDSDKRIALK